MWQLMMEFYDEKGMNSWSKGIVPSFVTSNAFIGRCYARLISGYISDLCAMQNAMDKSETLYVIEVGGGSGKFAFHVLKALECIRDRIDFSIDNIVYILTDFTESNIKVWEEHPALKPFVESNRLDFAKFEAVNDQCLYLRKSEKVISKGQVKNPICIIANYVIDTLSHDIFRVHDGILQEGLVSIRTQEIDDPKEVKEYVGAVSNIETKYLYRDIADNLEDYYKNVVAPPDQSHIASILEGYRDYFTHNQITSDKDETKCHDASLLIPIGFIKALRNLSDLSNGKALIITGDKGMCLVYTD
jgi:SAM-dependent MidA family methyltransferase